MPGYSAVTTNILTTWAILSTAPTIFQLSLLLSASFKMVTFDHANRDFRFLKVTASLTTYSRIMLSAVASLIYHKGDAFLAESDGIS